MVAEWDVPAPPYNNGGLLYLFDGLSNSTGIIQPVLQYGAASVIGGGNYWRMMNIMVLNGNGYVGAIAIVSPNDHIKGWVTSFSCSGNGSCNWNIFYSINGGVAIGNSTGVQSPMTRAHTSAFEWYRVNSCRRLSTSAGMWFYNIAFSDSTGDVTQSKTWYADVTPGRLDCQQSITAIQSGAGVFLYWNYWY